MLNNRIEKPVFEGEILLCDDSKMNQEIVAARLAKMGLKTVAAENGHDGLMMVKTRLQRGQKPFDLIFMDIHMPVMGGLEAAEAIRRLNTGTPIVAMSANDSPADRERYRTHGMADCVGTPATTPSLLDCLVKYILPASRDAAITMRGAQEDEALKAKLIHSFVRNNATKHSDIIEAMRQSDRKRAHRLAHTLKGNAGMLGKSGLQQAARNLERQLAQEDGPVGAALMDALKAELDAVLAEFALLITENPSAEPMDKEAALTLLEELEALLDGGSLECLHRVDGLRPVPGSGDLVRQIENFEFEVALGTLSKLKGSLADAGEAGE